MTTNNGWFISQHSEHGNTTELFEQLYKDSVTVSSAAMAGMTHISMYVLVCKYRQGITNVHSLTCHQACVCDCECLSESVSVFVCLFVGGFIRADKQS